MCFIIKSLPNFRYSSSYNQTLCSFLNCEEGKVVLKKNRDSVSLFSVFFEIGLAGSSRRTYVYFNYEQLAIVINDKSIIFKKFKIIRTFFRTKHNLKKHFFVGVTTPFAVCQLFDSLSFIKPIIYYNTQSSDLKTFRLSVWNLLPLRFWRVLLGQQFCSDAAFEVPLQQLPNRILKFKKPICFRRNQQMQPLGSRVVTRSLTVCKRRRSSISKHYIFWPCDSLMHFRHSKCFISMSETESVKYQIMMEWWMLICFKPSQVW